MRISTTLSNLPLQRVAVSAVPSINSLRIRNPKQLQTFPPEAFWRQTVLPDQEAPLRRGFSFAPPLKHDPLCGRAKALRSYEADRSASEDGFRDHGILRDEWSTLLSADRIDVDLLGLAGGWLLVTQ